MQRRRGPATVTEESDAIVSLVYVNTLGRLHDDNDSEARRPACSDSTDVPTGDREVLKMQAVVNDSEGPL